MENTGVMWGRRGERNRALCRKEQRGARGRRKEGRPSHRQRQRV